MIVLIKEGNVMVSPQTHMHGGKGRKKCVWHHPNHYTIWKKFVSVNILDLEPGNCRVEFDDTDIRDDHCDIRFGKYAINDITALFLMIAFDEGAGIKKIGIRGAIKVDLNLTNRTYVWERYGMVNDLDLNVAENLNRADLARSHELLRQPAWVKQEAKTYNDHNCTLLAKQGR